MTEKSFILKLRNTQRGSSKESIKGAKWSTVSQEISTEGYLVRIRKELGITGREERRKGGRERGNLHMYDASEKQSEDNDDGVYMCVCRDWSNKGSPRHAISLFTQVAVIARLILAVTP